MENILGRRSYALIDVNVHALVLPAAVPKRVLGLGGDAESGKALPPNTSDTSQPANPKRRHEENVDPTHGNQDGFGAFPQDTAIIDLT